ncbi:prepilin-type N-terminal cleavage/methylation domain-containing protein [Elusimicrobium simillimum]|uniref:type IV pilin protein n=1 Tax=Elusimicrobium simillimum TaxID=3143438 RepID=UPI003C6F21D8
MKKGFTLIELLVVVLIIGILAAIALPQYTKAVKKSRAAEVATTISALEKAGQRYAMAGIAPSAIAYDKDCVDMLDIDLSGGTYAADVSGYKTKYFTYGIACHPDGRFEVNFNDQKGEFACWLYIESSGGIGAKDCTIDVKDGEAYRSTLENAGYDLIKAY